jgi:hypothetical protein
VSLELDAHRQFIGDRPRVDALERAIAAAVRPGDVVIDLASGTGILGLLACRAGASRVYCIESGGIIALARDLARANGFADRMQFVLAHSSYARLPEPADVLISDQIGQFGFEAGLVQTVADVRTRLLKPGGRIIPERVTMYLAPVETPALRDVLTFWSSGPVGFSFGPAREVAVNSGHRLRIEPGHLLGPGVAGAAIETQTIIDAPFDCCASLTASRDGLLDGIGGWFVADLAGGVAMTNAPGDVNRIDRRNVVFPIDHAVPLRAGDVVDVSMRIRPSDLLVKWTVEAGGRSFSHSTLAGMLIPREDLERTRPTSTPRLTDRGVARRTVLELCDGRPLAAVEREVFARHRDLFDSEAAAQVFVAEVVTRYCV